MKLSYPYLLLFIISLAGVLCPVVHAETFRFRHYKVEDGLPSNTVRSLTQDSFGFMWFGTENGLSRFDGYTFKNFSYVSGDSTSIGSNYIYSFYEDTEQKLWVGTNNGVYIYDPELEQFSSFTKMTKENTKIESHITGILADQNGNIWFSSLTQGIFLYDRQADVLSQYLQGSGNGELSTNSISDLYIDSSNRLWVVPRINSGVLNYYVPDTDSFVNFQMRDTQNNPVDIGAYTITEDSDHTLWVGTWESGLCKLNRETGYIETFLKPGTPEGISHIHHIIEYSPGTLLISSDDGLSIFYTHTLESELISTSELKGSTLSNKFVYQIHKDNEGGLWLGTYHGGVNYAPPPKGNITGYSHSKYKNSVGGDIVSCFSEDKTGKIWIGTDDGGVSRFDPVTKSFTNYMPEEGKNSLSYYNIHSLCADDDKIWIGTYSGGLNILDLRTNRFSHPPALAGYSIYSIHKDADQSIWLGTMENIFLYDSEKDSFILMKEVGYIIYSIVDDPEGNIWFATRGQGIHRYNKHSGEWKHYSYDPGNPNSLPSNQINSLHLDREGTLWVGTDNGLAQYNKEGDSFSDIPFYTDNNTIIHYVRSVNGYLWITTINGLICYDPAKGTSQTLSTNDGLQSNQFNINAGLYSSSGELYLGTTNGFNVILPEDIFANHFIPPVYITNIQISNQDIPISEQGILPLSALLTKQIELSYKERAFSIEYVSLAYRSPEKNQYRYKLDGFDNEWNVIGNQRKATYTNLPAGKYIFRVMGSNSDGIWNEKETMLTIVIHPPFWRTPFAYFLYVLLFLGLSGYTVFFFRRRTELQHKRRIRKIQREKEKELHEAKINFFTHVAHEIRTPVSLITGPLEELTEYSPNLPESLQSNMEIINRNSQRLLSLVNQLLDFRKAEEGGFIIRFAKHDIDSLIRNVYIRFSPQAKQNDITFSLQIEEPGITAVVDAEALTKIISNLFSNAIKHARSKITAYCYIENNHLVIKVTDDGIGIIPEDLKNIFLPFYQAPHSHKPGTGIGLSLVKLLTDAHHGMIEVESTPDVQTTFTLTLPINQEEATSLIQSDKKESILLADEDIGKMNTPETIEVSLPQQTSKSLILLVDDNPDLRKFLKNSLSKNYNIIEAKNGKQALTLLEKNPVDLIICDIMMPIMDGVTFTRLMKENIEFCHIPLILLTAKTDNVSKLSAMQSGADIYIEKPFSPQLLQIQIVNLLKMRSILQKKFSETPLTPLSSVSVNNADERFLNRINEIIEQNLQNTDFSVGQLAEELRISRSSLFSKVRSLVDMTPNELIQLIRLKKAAVLLSKGEFRINEVCYQVGFNNPSYFAKCFQKQFGMPPKDFIKPHQPPPRKG